MYANPFTYKRPLSPGRDDLITIERRILLEKAMTGLELGHWLAVLGGKKSGKTSFLLRLIDEFSKNNSGCSFLMFNMEEMRSPDHAEFENMILRGVADLLPETHANNELANFQHRYLKEFLAGLSKLTLHRTKIIFILDGFESLPKAFAQEIYRSLIEVHHAQASTPALANYQFVVAGTLTLNDLQIKNSRAFSEYAMKVFLEDFRYEDIEEMLQRVSRVLDIPRDPGVGRLLYEATGGTGYLIQKTCYRVLETANIRKRPPRFTVRTIEEAIASIIREGETVAEMIIRHVEKDNELVDALVRTIRSGALKSHKFDRHLKSLVALGALSERNGVYRPRNAIYKSIFQDYFTTEHLAEFYFSRKKYYHAKNLYHEAVTEQLEAKNALEAILAHSTALGDNLQAHDLAKGILQTFMNAIDGVEGCSLILPDKNHDELRIFDSIGHNIDDIAEFYLKNGEGVAGLVMQTGRIRIVRDITDEIECPEFVNRELAVRMNVGAMISLPLRIADEVIGVINVCLGKPREFTSSEIKILEILAAQSSAVLRNMPLHLSLKRHQNHLDIIHSLIKEAGQHKNADVVFEKILLAIEKITDSNMIYLVYRERSIDPWHFKLPKVWREIDLNLPDINNGRGTAAFAMASAAPYFSTTAEKDNHYFEIWQAVRSELAIPLKIDGEISGCLGIAREVDEAFSDAQFQLLTMLADLASVAIKNHRLYGIAESRTQQVITSKGIGEAISHEKSLQEILDFVAKECLNIVGYPNKIAAVMLKDQHTGKLLIKAVSGEPLIVKSIKKPQPVSEKSLAAFVAKQGKPAFTDNLQYEPAYHTLHPEIRSEISIPLIFRDEAIGVIDIQSTKPEDFDRLDQESLVTIAHNAAVAIANAHLSEELAQAQMNLSKALETAAIEETVAGLTHDIKNIVATISSETQWLEKRDRENQLEAAEVKKAIRGINAQVKRIEDFTSDLRDRTTKRVKQTTPVKLRTIIEEAVRLISAKAFYGGVEIKKAIRALDAHIFADSGLLVRAFFNIMSNAVDAMSSGGTLSIRTESEGSLIGIFFSDTGSGIPKQLLNKVIDPLFTTKKQGYGLGLAITKRIVESDHGGKLVLKSRKGKGTTVEVWLPASPRLLTQPETSGTERPVRSKIRNQKNGKQRTGKILVVNDDVGVLSQIKQVLRHEGHRVRTSASGKAAVGWCKKTGFDAIVLDYHLKKDRTPTQSARDFFPSFKRYAPSTPIILTSATLDPSGVPPEIPCDHFLEINLAFWQKIVELINSLPLSARI